MSPYVEATGVGSSSAAPDMVCINARIQSQAGDVAAALGDASQRSAGVAQAARDHGVADRDIQTGGAGVHPQHDPQGQRIIGYTAYESLQVRVRDQSRVGALITAFAGVAGNALAIDSISLEISDPAPLLEQAREAAFANALAKANQFAQLSGRTLGSVRWVTDVASNGGSPIPRHEMMAMKADLSPEMGENTVTTRVTVRWEWT